jgi:hypothetical protein
MIMRLKKQNNLINFYQLRSSRVRKLFTAGLVALLAISLTACSKSDAASGNSSAGPSVWNDAQKKYLQEIYAANLAANDVLPEGAYIDMANTVCEGFTQGTKTEALLALLKATAEQNGLPIGDREVFGPTIAAAAVTYICPENINNLVK